MRAEPSALVRRAVVHALNVVRANPAAQALLADAAQNDPSEDVRQLAKAVLDSAAAVAQR